MLFLKLIYGNYIYMEYLSGIIPNNKINEVTMQQHKDELDKFKSKIVSDSAKILFREIMEWLKLNVNDNTSLGEYRDIIEQLALLENKFKKEGKTNFFIDINDDLKYYINKEDSNYNEIISKIQNDGLKDRLNVVSLWVRR